MPVVRIVLCLIALTAAAGAQRSDSDELVVPHSDGQSGLCEPFDCGTRIQQVFDASAVPSKIRIDALELFNNVRQSGESFVEPARYQFYLSTTQASSTTVTANMDGNLGADNTLVADFTVSGFGTFFTGAVRIPLTAPYAYNPRKGNLLLEIRKDQTANYGDGTVYVDGNTAVPGVALVTDQFGVQPSLGMTIGFVGRFLGRRTQ